MRADMDIMYRRSDRALSADVGEDVIALNVQKGHCYGMEKVAADVWSMLELPSSLAQLCARLTDRYEVDPETCRLEVANLLRQFEQEGLIERA